MNEWMTSSIHRADDSWGSSFLFPLECKCQCGSVCSLLVSSVPCRSIIRVRVSVLPCLSTSLTTQDVDLSVGFLFVAYAEASFCNFFGLLALHLHTAGCVGVVNSSMLQLLPVFCCACCIQAKGCCYQISGRAWIPGVYYLCGKETFIILQQEDDMDVKQPRKDSHLGRVPRNSHCRAETRIYMSRVGFGRPIVAHPRGPRIQLTSLGQLVTALKKKNGSMPCIQEQCVPVFNY